MCSIIGGTLTKNSKKNLQHWADMLKHRGKAEGAGYFVMEPDGTIFFMKSMSLSQTLKALKKHPNDSLFILHQRKASVGGKVPELAHPVKSKNTTTFVIHNGTNKIYKDFYDSKSDTEGVANLLDNITDITNGKILFSFGVAFIVKKGKLYFYRDKSRPLVFNKELELFASEPVFDGEWWDIKSTGTIKPFESIKDFELGEHNVIGELNPNAEYCYTCNKIHLHEKKGTQCAICEIRGETYNPYVKHTGTNRYGATYSHNTTGITKSKQNTGQVVKLESSVYYHVPAVLVDDPGGGYVIIKPFNNFTITNVTSKISVQNVKTKKTYLVPQIRLYGFLKNKRKTVPKRTELFVTKSMLMNDIPYLIGEPFVINAYETLYESTYKYFTIGGNFSVQLDVSEVLKAIDEVNKSKKPSGYLAGTTKTVTQKIEGR